MQPRLCKRYQTIFSTTLLKKVILFVCVYTTNINIPYPGLGILASHDYLLFTVKTLLLALLQNKYINRTTILPQKRTLFPSNFLLGYIRLLTQNSTELILSFAIAYNGHFHAIKVTKISNVGPKDQGQIISKFTAEPHGNFFSLSLLHK